MTREEVLAIYSSLYAATYDGKFLHSEHYEEATAFELQWLRDHLPPKVRWLDVACGTGWFLGQFPGVTRCGLDLSPAMLEHARLASPGVPFLEGDFREAHPELRGQWDLVTMMWWAYCYAGSLAAIRQTIGHLASWTAPGGSCLVPFCDPEELCRTRIENQLGGTEITAVVWNWTDDRNGTVHESLIAPHRAWLLRQFETHFESVQVLDYPQFRADAVGGIRRAIWARAPR